MTNQATIPGRVNIIEDPDGRGASAPARTSPPPARYIFAPTHFFFGHVSGERSPSTYNETFITAYIHLKSFKVKKGMPVSRGRLIGYSGNTGKSSGPHLHFTTIVTGNASTDRISGGIPRNGAKMGRVVDDLAALDIDLRLCWCYLSGLERP